MALIVKVKKSKQERVTGGSNYDSNSITASEIDGYSLVHRRCPRPTRGLHYDDRDEDSDTNMDTENGNPGGTQVNDKTMYLPFETPTCNL
jgi:hypothetical protein